MGKTGVIIVNWNGGESILECLRHLDLQKDVNPRILVVDNNSTDESLVMIRELYPDTEIICNSNNPGFAVACNQGVSHLHDCQWIALLNPDAFPEPDWLTTLVNIAKGSSEHHSFASLIVSHNDPTIIDSAGDAYLNDGRGVHRLHGQNINKVNTFPIEVFAAAGAGALYRRESLIEVGGFDERFFCYYEDIDLGFRLQLLGYKCLLVPAARISHVGGGTTGGVNNDHSLFYCQRNFVWTFFKNMPALLLFLYLPKHILYLVGGLVRGYRLGKLRLMLRATRDALKELPSVLMDRWRSQLERRINIHTLRDILGPGEGYE
ncbi:MAG: GT2 family glycosyltransferase [Planctomycetota bacterium]|jgi:GT2 family glycosyltransferase